MSDVYAFQSEVDDFINDTPWVEAAFPFVTSDFSFSSDERSRLI